MGQARDFLRVITPAPLKRLYRQARLAAQSAVRSLALKVETCQVEGVIVRIGVSSPIERDRVQTYSTKEPETLDWLKYNLRDDDVFVDIGANIGLYSLFAAKLRPLCTVYAFEPESQNFASLCRNIVLNNVQNVIPCNCALSDREAFDLFFVGELQAGSALHALGRPNACRPEGAASVVKQGTLTVSLDALVGCYGLPQPTLLKLDVDGIEGKILLGARTILKSSRLRSVLVEVNRNRDAPVNPQQGGSDEPDPERQLNQAGYRVSRKGSSSQELNGILSRNYIFDHVT